MVREAHKRNLKTTGQIGTITYHEAAELGIDNLEHGFMASSDFDHDKKEGQLDGRRAYMALLKLDVNSDEMKNLISYLIEKHVVLTSTLPVFEPNPGHELILGGGEDALLPEIKKLVGGKPKSRLSKCCIVQKRNGMGKTIL